MKRTALTLLILAFAAAIAHAGIVSVSTGTAAPPASLGGVPISPFNPSGLPVFSPIGTLTHSTMPGLTATLSTPGGPLDVRQIGSGWATWSHGYGGEVYYTQGATAMGVALSLGVQAFLIYAEPNPFGLFTITVTTNDGGILSQVVDGLGGAAGFGFYGTGGTWITGIGVTSDVDFAVGELYAAPYSCCGPPVPEPTSPVLLGFGLVALIWYGWRQGKG